MTTESNRVQMVETGNPALDTILEGGLTSGRVYLVEGDPGTGKTTLALQFLLEGAKNGQTGLYVTLSETKEELEAVAASHGWSMQEIEVYELVDSSELVDSNASQYSMFEPSEVELSKTIRGVLEHVEQSKPTRVAFDSLSEMRLLAQSPLRYRRQILALKHFFTGRNCTVLMLDDNTAQDADQQLQSIAHGVIRLEHMMGDYGGERRRLRVIKHRGQKFQGGYHDFQLLTGGLNLFPRKGQPQPIENANFPLILSGNESLDHLVGGGLSPGTSTLLLGPAGVGKSSTAMLYAISAASRGEKAVFFIFDETREVLLERAASLNMPLQKYLESGNILIHQLDPGELLPGEFACQIREAIQPSEDGRRVSVVVIDSLNGYMNAMPHEHFLIVQMHEILKTLAKQKILTFLVVAQHGMLGHMATPVDASYLADAVILFRYFEATGELRQAISVVKKRTGSHERTIREFQMRDGVIRVGSPLDEFQGILSGTPTFTGKTSKLLGKEHE
ncbi:ATPase domain-containing protein [Gimesia algae]|uniref:non-specific serine/threonine protein kinase n=1 Tax=Gimesia algae TaxID=2527971 RepID=A0A517VB01_9PLAN|nr:ATPase domain-containing protein [Gimesia algae]QDT90191.1 Circadian clock protein kinase KaiC [Gimesia algae]